MKKNTNLNQKGFYKWINTRNERKKPIVQIEDLRVTKYICVYSQCTSRMFLKWR